MGFGLALQTLGRLGLITLAATGPSTCSPTQASTPHAEVRPADAPRPQALTVYTRDIPVADFKIHMRIVGNPQVGTPIVAMPGGMSLSHEYLRPLEKLAAADRAFVAFDTRGVGGSTQPKDSRPQETQGPPRGWTLESLSGDIEAVRKAIGADKIILLGHSASGANVMDYVTRYPERVAALILLDPIPPTFDATMDTVLTAVSAHYAAHGIAVDDLPVSEPGTSCKARLPGSAQHWYAVEPPLQEVEKMLGGTDCHEDGDLRYGGAVGYDLRPALAKTTVRTLVLNGDKTMFPGMAQQSVDAFPKDKVTHVVLPGVGHAAWVEDEKGTLDAISRFLSAPTAGGSR